MNNPQYLQAAQTAPLPISSVQDLQTLGQVLAASNLFGKRNPAEGLAIVAMCHQKRISWLDFMQNFHMIQGVVSKKTDAILADFHRVGGKHKIVSRTADKAEANFRLGDAEYTSTITWADCLEEPFVYVGKESDVIAAIANGRKYPNGRPLELKAKYSTPRARMQMLWARCVSDGVRVVAPECVQGIYTPEETSDLVEVPVTPASAFPPVREAQGVAVSPSPINIEVCPCGKLMGKRWDSLDTAVLQQALSGTSPLITVEMKDYIRSVLADREGSAASAPSDAEAAEAKEAAND